MTAPHTERIPRESDGDGWGSRPRWRALLPVWWLGNLLAWLGGGHWRDIADRHERSGFQLSGVFVVLNAIIAGAVMTLAAVGVAEVDFLDALPYTLPWGLFVGAFDRTITAYVPRDGARRGEILRALGARLAMGVLLGVVVAEFANLWFFRHPIDRQLQLNIDQQVAESQASVNGSQGLLASVIAERERLDTAVTDAEKASGQAYRLYICEKEAKPDCPKDGTVTGRPGNGPETRERERLYGEAEEALRKARDDRNAVKVWVPAVEGRPAPVAQTLDAQIAALETERSGQLGTASALANADRGVDARWRAMHDYTLHEPSALFLRIVVLVVLVAVDLVPLTAKILRGSTGHDDRIAMRRALLRARNTHHRDKRRKELEVRTLVAAHEQDAEREEADQVLHTRAEAARLQGEADRAIIAERERLRQEAECERLRRVAEAAAQSPLPAAPPDEPEPGAEPDRVVSAADMVASHVPGWWSQSDAGLVRMVFGNRFRALGPLVGGNVGSFGRMLVAIDQLAARDSGDRYVVIKAVPLPVPEEPARTGGLLSLFRREDQLDPTRMWQKEVAAASRLDHRAIGMILDAGVQDGYAWTAAPYYRPGSLTRWIEGQEQRGYPVNLAEALRLAEEIAGALAAAHGHADPVVHSDLKPDNVVLNGPQPVLIDWGLARLVDRTGGARSTGLPQGTRYFGAPEVFLEPGVLSGPLGPLADLWSLGATLYFLLTGEPPLERDQGTVFRMPLPSWEIAKKARDEIIVVTPLPQLLPELPAAVTELVHGLLSIDPRRRSPTADPWRAAAAVRQRIAGVAALAARHRHADLPVGRAAVAQAALRPPAPAPDPARPAAAHEGWTEPIHHGAVAVLPPTEHEPVLPRTEHEPVPPRTEHEPVPPRTEHEPVPPRTEHEPVLPPTEHEAWTAAPAPDGAERRSGDDGTPPSDGPAPTAEYGPADAPSVEEPVTRPLPRMRPAADRRDGEPGPPARDIPTGPGPGL